MRNSITGGHGRRFAPFGDFAGHCRGEHRRYHNEGRREDHRGHRGGGRHGGRLFDPGELRLLVLAMMAGQPRHGYELIKAIEERMGGSYSPSPGVIYPLLSWLEDMGYAVVEAEPGGRKRYRITPEGEGFVASNRAAVDALFSRLGADGAAGRGGVPDPVTRGMENLRLALRLRLRRGPLDEEAAARIAAALDEAARAVERG